MIRLILVIIIFAFFLVFIVFNLDNKCDISFGLKTIKDVPVFLSSLFSFVLGMMFTVPLVFSIGRKRKKSAVGKIAGGNLADDKSSNAPLLEGRKRWGKKDKKNQQETGLIKDEASSDTHGNKKEDSPYGIN